MDICGMLSYTLLRFTFVLVRLASQDFLDIRTVMCEHIIDCIYDF